MNPLAISSISAFGFLTTVALSVMPYSMFVATVSGCYFITVHDKKNWFNLNPDRATRALNVLVIFAIVVVAVLAVPSLFAGASNLFREITMGPAPRMLLP